MKYPISLFLVCLSAALVRVGAQTQTLVDAAGETVVVAVTLNPLGLPVTETLQTLDGEATDTTTSTTSTSTSTGTTTTQQINQGPVGQPPATTDAAGPTTYQYTTTDAAGNTQVLQDAYTPTSHVASFSTMTFTGQIVDFSSWSDLVGTNTVAAGLGEAAASSAFRLIQQKGLWAGAMALTAGTLGGAWLILL